MEVEGAVIRLAPSVRMNLKFLYRRRPTLVTQGVVNEGLDVADLAIDSAFFLICDACARGTESSVEDQQFFASHHLEELLGDIV